MSEFLGFKYSYSSEPQSSGANSSSALSGAELASPPSNLYEQQSLNIPNENPTLKKESPEIFLLRSLDIKKQLSLSFQGASHGGITKPQSRRNSAITIKSQNASDDDFGDDNNTNSNDNNSAHEMSSATNKASRRKYNPANAAATAAADGADDEDDDQGHERKRRDNINEKIQELLTLVPSEFFSDLAPANSSSTAQTSGDVLEHDAAVAAAVKNSGTKDGKPNKGQILTKSVEYIQYLQKVIDENNRKEVELVMKLKSLELKRDNRQLNVPINVGHTSAEIALGEIGVGPLSDDYFKQVLQHSSKKAPIGSP